MSLVDRFTFALRPLILLGWSAVLLASGRVAWSDLVVTSNNTQNGGALVVSPGGDLLIDDPSAPTLRLTGGATSVGVQSLVVGNVASGNLQIAEGSVLENTGTKPSIHRYGAVSTYSAFGYAYLGLNSGSSATATVEGGGSQWNNTGSLYVGYFGSAALNIQNGGEVTNDDAIVGYRVGSNSTATVDGLGSAWNFGGDLFVGQYGQGTLNIQNGGVVTGNYDTLGYRPGAVGIARISGAGSQWNDSYLSIGKYGVGNLEISQEGQMRSSGSMLGEFAGSVGTATIEGPGSEWNLDSTLTVGSVGSGNLNVRQGAKVYCQLGQVGSTFESLGIVTVSGANTELNNRWLLVGREGQALLNIRDGAVVTSTGFARLADGSSSHTFVTIDGAGSVWNVNLELDSSEGSADLSVINGGKLVCQSAWLGRSTWNDMRLTIDSPGSSANFVQGLIFGRGEFRLQNGARCQSGGSSFGKDGYGSALVTVDGRGTVWNNDGGVDIGYLGDATLTVQNGARVISSYGRIGDIYGTTGVVTVDGSESSWKITEAMEVGYHGKGTLAIQNGGKVSSGALAVAASAYAEGKLTVTGSESLLINREDCFLGGTEGLRGGAGTLEIADEGVVVVGGLTRLYQSGVLTINGGSFRGYDLDASEGTFNFNSGTLHVSGAMTLPTSATFTVPSGGTYINDGTVNVPVDVANGGTVAGHGSFGGLTIQAGGTASPGNSPGTLTDASTTLTGGGAFLWEINALAADGGLAGNGAGWDLWNLGELTLNSSNANPFLIKLASLTSANDAGPLLNWNPNQSQQWLIATASNSGGIFDSTLSSFAIDASQFAQFNTFGGQFGLLAGGDGSQLLLTYTAVPEPQSLALLAIGLLGICRIARVRRVAR